MRRDGSVSKRVAIRRSSLNSRVSVDEAPGSFMYFFVCYFLVSLFVCFGTNLYLSCNECLRSFCRDQMSYTNHCRLPISMLDYCCISDVFDV